MFVYHSNGYPKSSVFLIITPKYNSGCCKLFILTLPKRLEDNGINKYRYSRFKMPELLDI